MVLIIGKTVTSSPRKEEIYKEETAWVQRGRWELRLHKGGFKRGSATEPAFGGG